MRPRTMLVALASASLLAGSAVGASAQDTKAVTLTAGERQQITSFLAENGVDKATQDALVAKWESGQLLDANRIDRSPVRTEDFTNADERGQRHFYADGSVRVVAAETAPYLAKGQTSSINKVTGCSRFAGSGYYVMKYCRVQDNSGSVMMAFEADFQIFNGAYDKIDRIRNSEILVTGGTFSGASLTMTKAREDYYGPARARHAATITIGGIVQGTSAHELRVGSNTYWTYNRI